MSLLFAGFGVAMPFVPRWLEEERGLSGFEIAMVLSSAQLARIIVGPLIATWADGFADRATPVKLLAITALLLYLGFFVVDGFVALALFGFAGATASQAIVPLVEGGALRTSLRPDGLPYGWCRAVGSGAFIVSTVLAGALVGWFGVAAAPATILVCFAAMAASAWLGLRADPATGSAHTLRFADRFALGARLLRQPRFAFALAAAGVIQASHAFYYNFTAIVWRDQGVADIMIGFLIAFGVLVEIMLLFMLPRVERRFQPEILIAFGAVGAGVRWTCFAFAPPVALLWPLQALHALSFAATHVGMMRLIQREASEDISAFAQTLYAALAAGLFMGLAAIASGALHDAVGAMGYLAMAVLAGLGLALISPLVLQKL